MTFLYLVAMVAANTKYSINSLLPPVPACVFLAASTSAQKASRRDHHWCIALNSNPISSWGPAPHYSAWPSRRRNGSY